MIDKARKIEAKKNFDHFLADGLIIKKRDEIAKGKYMENAELLKKANQFVFEMKKFSLTGD